MKISALEQFRIINDPNDVEGTKVPVMPLIIALDNEVVGEAKSIRGLMCVIIDEYIDAEDAVDDWHLRVEAARKESMKALSSDINVVMYDSRHKDNNGVIENNYAADLKHPDYELDFDNAMKIRVESDRLFLISLLKIGSIRILEREDSFLLRPYNNEECVQSCENCIHKDNHKCLVYDFKIAEDEGSNCNSFGIKYSYIEEYKGGRYEDLSNYNLDELIKKYEKII